MGSFKLNGVEIEDTFAEAFPMLVSRVLITAENDEWALIASRTATGFASSIIMSPAEAGIEGITVPKEKTPDGRVGRYIQIYHRSGRDLKLQLIARIGQCILTCPTTNCFNGFPEAKKKLKIGDAIRLFGDGFEEKTTINGREVWKIPVMEGEFLIERRFGIKRGVAGGNFLIMAEDREKALEAARRACEAIRKIEGVILPFPGGICRSGSKVGSLKYKLPASTNHIYCPLLRGKVKETQVPEGVNSIYEIVFNGLNPDIIKRATREGILEAIKVKGVIKITAVNFGGKLGPIKVSLKDALT